MRKRDKNFIRLTLLIVDEIAAKLVSTRTRSPANVVTC